MGTEVWSTLLGAGVCLVVTPTLDLRVVAPTQHLGHGSSPVLQRAGVLWVFETANAAVTKAFRYSALLVPQYAGNQTNTRLHHRHGRDFTAGEHEVTQRGFFVDIVAYAL